MERQGHGGTVEILPYNIAYDEHRTRIITERQQITPFFFGYVVHIQKICGYLAPHRASAEESDQHGERTVGRHTEKTAEDRRRDAGDQVDSSCADQKIG